MLWQTPGWRGFPASPPTPSKRRLRLPQSLQSTQWLSFLPCQYRALKASEALMGLPMCVLADPGPCPVLAELSHSYHLRFYGVQARLLLPALCSMCSPVSTLGAQCCLLPAHCNPNSSPRPWSCCPLPDWTSAVTWLTVVVY